MLRHFSTTSTKVTLSQRKKICIVNKIIIVNTIVFPILRRNVTHSAIITRKPTKKGNFRMWGSGKELRLLLNRSCRVLKDRNVVSFSSIVHTDTLYLQISASKVILPAVIRKRENNRFSYNYNCIFYQNYN